MTRFCSVGVRRGQAWRLGLCICAIALAACSMEVLRPAISLAKARVKDVATIAGARKNPLVGYGIVVGLAGSGDQKMPMTTQAAANMLKNLGVSIPAGALKLKNVASVLVTADLPAFARPGSYLDVTVSSIGDATSLYGGLLVMTPLSAANGDVYAVAQGSIVIGAGSQAGRDAHRTVGRVPNGATVEREVPVTLVSKESNSVDILLIRPDFTTASAIGRAIDLRFGEGTAKASSAGTVTVTVKPQWLDIVGVLSEIEGLLVDVDVAAKVVVSERTGAVIMGGDVRILPVSVAYGSLSIAVSAPSTDAAAKSGNAGPILLQKLASLPKEGTVADLVKLLNVLGAAPKDIIGILAAMKSQGSLLAELETI